MNTIFRYKLLIWDMAVSRIAKLIFLEFDSFKKNESSTCMSNNQMKKKIIKLIQSNTVLVRDGVFGQGCKMLEFFHRQTQNQHTQT